MASLSELFLSVLLLLALVASAPTEARPAPQNLAARLQEEGVKECWDSLMDLRSCTGEVILFFLNGEAYLGASCCEAIRVIERSCWAADTMLAALGFTAEEGDVLRGYCDAAPPQPPPESAPVPDAADAAGADWLH